MGETTAEESWHRIVERVASKLAEALEVEAIIVFGSWARSGGGEWSDVDILVVSDDVEDIDILERFKLTAEYRSLGADVFVYTFKELANMLEKGDPLAISALVEGVSVRNSERVKKLAEKAKKRYIRKKRVWIDLYRVKLDNST